jgi:hypothetical protein
MFTAIKTSSRKTTFLLSCTITRHDSGVFVGMKHEIHLIQFSSHPTARHSMLCVQLAEILNIGGVFLSL